ncbi:hypothetical protein CDAR_105711 [Caerostris darwini]|uniref:Uncharacterized protein n=1 Tax=Caerostris darwini TaxID=1538125 RepID=A0AAV4N8R5_9ARAC|nr:hypothetical protein CDAR_105711 [Caerostris darwini]
MSGLKVLKRTLGFGCHKPRFPGYSVKQLRIRTMPPDGRDQREICGMQIGLSVSVHALPNRAETPGAGDSEMNEAVFLSRLDQEHVLLFFAYKRNQVWSCVLGYLVSSAFYSLLGEIYF